MSEITTPSTPQDAATVILVRDARDGFEVFFVRRHDKSGFMAGAHVFPGGRLDVADQTEAIRARVLDLRDEAHYAARLNESPRDHIALGLHIAALREAFEEAGVFLGTPLDTPKLNAMRAQLAKEASFADELVAVDAMLNVDALVPFTRWITPEVEPRRYDARFFIAVDREGRSLRHDGKETTASEWLRPTDALDMKRRGELSLPPPTEHTLGELAAFTTTDALVTWARARKPPLVRPQFFDEGEAVVLALPGDPLHPERERVVGAPTRFVLPEGKWWRKNDRLR